MRGAALQPGAGNAVREALESWQLIDHVTCPSSRTVRHGRRGGPLQERLGGHYVIADEFFLKSYSAHNIASDSGLTVFFALTMLN